MAFRNKVAVDLRHVTCAAEAKASTTTGRRSAKVSMSQDDGARVEFQLGKRRRDALRCPFGMEKTSKEARDDDARKQIKVEITGEAKDAVLALEDAIVKAGAKHSTTWFKGVKAPLSEDAVRDRFQSKVFASEGKEDLLTLKVDTTGPNATKVRVCTDKGDGTYTKLVKGTYADLEGSNMRVLPYVKVGNGVYFMDKSFGVSLVAKELIVVRNEASMGGGGIVLSSEDDDDSDAEE